jgi:hypothetical protein
VSDKPRKWNIPLTYAPKIPGVLNGSIWQTIRVGRKYRVGDLVSFHGWSGQPYRSKWSFRTPYFPLVMARPIRIRPGGIGALFGSGMDYRAWSLLDELALVLQGMHPIPEDGIEAQILRWRPTP